MLTRLIKNFSLALTLVFLTACATSNEPYYTEYQALNAASIKGNDANFGEMMAANLIMKPYYAVGISSIDGLKTNYFYSTQRISPGTHTIVLQCIVQSRYVCGQNKLTLTAKSAHFYQAAFHNKPTGYSLMTNLGDSLYIEDITGK